MFCCLLGGTGRDVGLGAGDYSPDVKMLYRIWMPFGQHSPTRCGCHAFSMGVHCAQVMAMATPRQAFTVMMMNQTRALNQPDEMRSTVTANEVLLHRAARIEKLPARLEKRRKMSRLFMLNWLRGRPKPMFTHAEMKAAFATRESCNYHQRLKVSQWVNLGRLC